MSEQEEGEATQYPPVASTSVSGGGRGRGRGRGGGVPLLPSGMWESLTSNTAYDLPSSNDADNDVVLDRFLQEKKVGQFDDAPEEEHPPARSHHTTTSSDGYAAAGSGGNNGKIDKDAKGKDWNCHSCSNLNWSWRTSCNACGVARQVVFVGDGEHRDGAGRGFNERQDRASATAVEIDEDGFDDFGRRVKKVSRSDKQAKEEAALKRMADKYKHLLPLEGLPAPTPSTNTASSTTNTERKPDDKKDSNRTDDRRGPPENKRGHSRDRPAPHHNYQGDRHNNNNERERERDRNRYSNNNNSTADRGRRDDSRSRRKSRSRSRSNSRSRKGGGGYGRR